MRRWWFLVGGASLLLGLIVAAGWRDLTTARTQLNDARAALLDVVEDPLTLQSKEGRGAARRTVDEALGRVDSARRRVDESIPLRLAGWVPGLSRQKTGLIHLIMDARTGATISRRLLTKIDDLGSTTSVVDGTIPEMGLASLEDAVRAAGRALRRVERDEAGLWRSVAEARRQLNDVAQRTSTRLLEGADALGAARTFVGAEGPRRYFVAVQNNAEMRNQGMVLSYAVISFEHGRMTVERSGSIDELRLARPISLPLPSGTNALFGDFGPTERFQSVNTTPDFPWSGRAMGEMYEQASGQRVDGVVAVDVPGLAAILAAVGPVRVSAIAEELTADNVARILLNDLYLASPDRAKRKDRLGEVASAVIAKLTTGERDAIALGRQLGEAAAGGHFRLWSSNEDEEHIFERSGLGGGPAVKQPTRTFHVAVQNATQAKLDYFVKPEVAIEVVLTPGGTAVVRTKINVVNTAPAGRQPSYQLGGFYGELKPGEYVARVHLWAPRGSILLGGVEESGLIGVGREIHVDPESTETVEFETVIPQAVRGGRLQLRLVPQPRLEPVKLRIRLQADGWDVDGEKVLEPDWSRTLTVGWGVSR